MADKLDFEQYCVAERFLENVWWLVYLRWLVGASLVLYAAIIPWICELAILKTVLIAAAGGLILALNAWFAWFLRKARAKTDIVAAAAGVRRNVLVQAAWDMLCVAFAVLLTCGLIDLLLPLFALFLLYILLAGVLMSRTAALALVVLATALSAILPGGFYHVIIVMGFLIAALLSGRIGKLLAFREATLTQISQVLADKSAELDQANARLLELDRLRVEQVRRVSHELRSPLATVRNCLMRADELAPATAAEAGDMIKRALRRTQALMEFINDVLALARVESGRFEHQEAEPVNLGEVLERAGDALRGRAAEKNVALEMHISRPILPISAAPQYIEQLVTNLLTNAVKYTPEHGRVTASLRVESEQLVLEVGDTGIGISPEQCRHLFEQYFRTPEARRMDPNGTGLGLALVKQVVDRYKGAIAVDSQPGQGTRFIVRLPLKPGH